MVKVKDSKLFRENYNIIFVQTGITN